MRSEATAEPVRLLRRYRGRPAVLLAVLLLDATGGAVTLSARELFAGDAAWVLHSAAYGQRVAMATVALAFPDLARRLFAPLLVLLLAHALLGAWTYADPGVATSSLGTVVAVAVLAAGWCRAREAVAVLVAAVAVLAATAFEVGTAPGVPSATWLPAVTATALVPLAGLLFVRRRADAGAPGPVRW